MSNLPGDAASIILMNTRLKQRISRPRRRTLHLIVIQNGSRQLSIVRPSHFATHQFLCAIREWRPTWFTDYDDVLAENMGATRVPYPYRIPKLTMLAFASNVADDVRTEDKHLGDFLMQMANQAINDDCYLFWYHVRDDRRIIQRYILKQFDKLFLEER